MPFATLRAILQSLQPLRFRTLDDETLVLCARMYATLYGTVTGNALDEELAPRRELRSRLTSLLEQLLSRSDAHTDLRSRLELLEGALFVQNTSGAIFSRGLTAGCCRRSDTLIEECLSASSSLACFSPQERCGILRLICWRLNDMVPEEAREDAWFGCLQRTVSRWVEELQSAEGWTGLNDAEALQRLLPMLMSAGLLSASLPEEFIRRSADRYCGSHRLRLGRVDVLSRAELRSCCRLYEVLRLYACCGVGSHDSREELAALAERQLGHFGEGTVDAMMCLSIVLEHSCELLTEECQRSQTALLL